MVRASKVVFIFGLLGVALLSIVVVVAISFKPVASTHWASVKDVTERVQKGDDFVVLLCVYAEWDTTTYRHFKWLDRHLERIVKETGVVPCRIRSDKPEEQLNFDTLSRVIPVEDSASGTGFGFFSSRSGKSEWYCTVDSDLEFQEIVRTSQVLGGKHSSRDARKELEVGSTH